MRRVLVVMIVIALAVVLGEAANTSAGQHRAAGPSAARRETVPIAGVVTIAGRSYGWGDALLGLSYLTKAPQVKFVFSLIRQCRNLRVIGFASTHGGGLVAWVPNSFSGCMGVAGGGPSSWGDPGPCLQVFRTPADRDPSRIFGPTTWSRYHVLVAATNFDTCADLAAQVPGGVYGRTTAAFQGLPRGSTVVVKCQYTVNGRLADVVGLPTQAGPITKPAWRIYDQYVYTGTNDRLGNVPSCIGYALDL